MRRVIIAAVVLAALSVAYVAGQQAPMNARWYREPLAQLDPSTTIDVVADAVSRTCYAVYLYSTEEEFGMVSLGAVPCRR